MKNEFAPVALFVFKRLEHTKRTVEALLQNGEATNTDLYIFSDYWSNSIDSVAVDSVRSYISGIRGFKSLNLIYRPINYGLSKSIVNAVTEMLIRFESVIVLEDDLVVSKYFLQYMNESLKLYKYDDRVISIHGYIYPLKQRMPEAFFLRGADCWGWATWRRGWALFNSDGKALLEALKDRKLIRLFDFNGAYGYSQMLKSQIQGKNDSWAVRWYASAFLANKLTLYPGRSLVRNIGNDNSGTHCGYTSYHDTELSNIPICLTQIEVKPSDVGRIAFEQYLRQSNILSFTKIINRIKRAIKRVVL